MAGKRRRTRAVSPLLRRATVDPLRATMRMMLGVHPDRMAPGELAALRGRRVPQVVESVDVGAVIAWAVAGVLLFSGREPPTLAEAEEEARRVLLALAMERKGGSMRRVAQLVGSTRTTTVRRLRAVGLYPWPAEPDDGGVDAP